MEWRDKWQGRGRKEERREEERRKSVGRETSASRSWRYLALRVGPIYALFSRQTVMIFCQYSSYDNRQSRQGNTKYKERRYRGEDIGVTYDDEKGSDAREGRVQGARVFQETESILLVVIKPEKQSTIR